MKTPDNLLKSLLFLYLVSAIRVSGTPNLTPDAPAGWSEPIVVSTVPGTATNSLSYSSSDTLYLDWAVKNTGDTAAGPFYSALYVDGMLKSYWTITSLGANADASVTDFVLGSLTAGTHTLTLTNDWMGMVAENNETDNAFTKMIVVNAPAQPNLTPATPAGWSDKIVVSSATGTTTNSPFLFAADTVYVDWAVLNNGTGATGARFYTSLYVDGMLRNSWFTDPSLAPGAFAFVTDYPLGTFSVGTHMLMIQTDSTGAVAETNELDNSYSRQFVVSPPPQPNLAPYQAPGWSDKIVVGTNTGATLDVTPTTADTLYASWSVINNGTSSITNSFTTSLALDGVVLRTWTNSPPLGISSFISGSNVLLGELTVGLHTVLLTTDVGGAVSESSEGDNSYTKLVAVLQAAPGVLTLPADSLTDSSARLLGAVDPHHGAGYAWFEYGTNAAYGKVTPLQSFGVANTNLYATINGLGVETTYHFRLVAYNGGGTNYGADVLFTTPGPAIRIEPLALTFSVGIGAPPIGGDRTTSSSLPPSSASSEKLTDCTITNGLAGSQTVNVIAMLDLPPAVRARTDFSQPASLRALQDQVRTLQYEVLDRLAPGAAKLRHRFENLPGFSVQVTAEGLRALQAHPRVVSIEPVYELQPHLAQGLPLIHGLTHRAAYNGAGMAIAICDTGIDYNHPRLGGGGFPNWKVLGGYDTGEGDADPFPTGGHAHGTCCAGIAAGDLGTVEDYIGGVAFNARLYAIKISTDSAGTAPTDAMVAGWDWCVNHKNDNPDYPIMVISTSFGGGRHLALCDEHVPAMTAAANNAVAAGITVVASSGNEGYCDSTGWPACISNVISVAAVYDADFGICTPCVNAASCAPKVAGAGCDSGYYVEDPTAPDKVTAYANMAGFVSLLAPGNNCYTTDISGSGGYSSGDYDATFGGTSAACPYVAGAVACLQSAAKARTGAFLTPVQVKTLLIESGDPITDTKVALTKPRLNLERAIQSLPDSSQSFRIYNDGGGRLRVNSIGPETAAPWIQFTPSGPFEVAGNTYQDVSVRVEPALAPAGTATVRLLVNSSDADRTPYPGGVTIATLSLPQLRLTNLGATNGRFEFTLCGPANSNYVVEASGNLQQWSPLLTNSIPAEGSCRVTDSLSTNAPSRYYRARLQ